MPCASMTNGYPFTAFLQSGPKMKVSLVHGAAFGAKPQSVRFSAVPAGTGREPIYGVRLVMVGALRPLGTGHVADAKFRYCSDAAPHAEKGDGAPPF
jgi:hypothetical protein